MPPRAIRSGRGSWGVAGSDSRRPGALAARAGNAVPRLEGSVKTPEIPQAFASLSGGGHDAADASPLTGLSSRSRPRARGSTRPRSRETRPVTATTFLVSGRGWGHGVGMSQYGALGFANDGGRTTRSWATSTLAPSGRPGRPRAGAVGEAQGAVKLAPVPFRVRDVFGTTYPLAAGEHVLGPKLWVRSTVRRPSSPGRSWSCRVRAPRARPALPRPDRGRGHRPEAERRQRCRARAVPRRRRAEGDAELVAREALKAQAVAARSYALAHRLTGKGFDLYADVRSQVYGGIRRSPRTTAAIEATKGEVLLWEGRPIDALFHSTSGGGRWLRSRSSARRCPTSSRSTTAQRSLAGAPLGPTPVPRRRCGRASG